jgi:glycosyltransferase involved in cell wall biosynthesis
VPVIGRFGRFDPQKDYHTFVDAAARLHRLRPDVHFVLCGFDVDAANEVLASWIREAGVQDVCHLLGYRQDGPRVTAALDIATSSSAYGEAFPNVLGEAMACEVPCVATDIGDSSYIVGDTGLTVPPRNAGALANAWNGLLAQGPEHIRALGRRARQRVEEKFAIREVVRAYEDTYEAILNDAGVGNADQRATGSELKRAS